MTVEVLPVSKDSQTFCSIPAGMLCIALRYQCEKPVNSNRSNPTMIRLDSARDRNKSAILSLLVQGR
ncbi:MAG: hypothetical protein WB624_27650, partial [Xanthobacteraceae bacterium]